MEWEDVSRARHETTPSQLEDLALEGPRDRRLSWASVGGYDEVKHKLQRLLEWPHRFPDTFKRLGVQPAPGILLHGPSGWVLALALHAPLGKSLR
jgi:transitional endoplasmic reticulum ATPase